MGIFRVHMTVVTIEVQIGVLAATYPLVSPTSGFQERIRIAS